MTKRFSIATFNLFNFHKAGGRVYDEVRYDEESYDQKASWIAQQLRTLDADIVGFQEAWSEEALKDAVVRSGLYEAAHLKMQERDGIAVALVSRLPILRVDYIEGFPEGLDFSSKEVEISVKTFSRPVLRAEILLPGEVKAWVYVAHLKSKRPLLDEEHEDREDPRVKAVGYTRSLLVRAAEATALRWLVTQEMEGTRTPVVVMGDLNDGAGSVTTRTIAGDPPWWHSKDKRAAWDVLLYNAYQLQAKRSHRDVFYTHIHDFHYETLDHILVSEELSGFGPERIATFRGLQTWNDHLNSYPDKTKSDHAQVVARFEMAEKTST